MAGFFDYANPFGKKSPLRGINKQMGKFWMGTPEKHERVPTLLDQQMPLAEQLWAAGMGPGAGGAFGSAADYYRDLLSPDSETAQMMFAPEQRRFNEDIIPGLAEQFAGMGAGGLTSSGFRNAAVNAGTDLSERLGAIRANLRSQGAAGLGGIGQAGLQNFSQDVMTQPGTQGFLSQIGPALGTAAGAAIGGPAGAAIGGAAGNWLSSMGKNAFGSSNVGSNSSPYGNAPQMGQQNFKLPSFGGF